MSDRGMGGHLIDDTEEHLLKLAGVKPDEGSDVPADIADFYAVPDTEPVPGWTLEIPSELCYRDSQMGATLSQFKYGFTGEAKEWADENLRDPYWILGPSYNDVNHFTAVSRTFTAYFTSEHDYILVKMRYC